MWRVFSAVIMMIGLQGCAEITNRGGMIDWIEDRALFKADTKAMRVIRSYVLVAGLTRIAGKAPLSLEERAEVSQKIQTAVSLSRDAYDCAYGADYGPYGCIFIDDIMSQLDAAIIRLARITFLPEENRDLIAVLQKEMFGGDLPSNLFGAAGKIVEGAAELGISGGQAANIVGALMQLGRNALRSGNRLGPLYRDSVELQIRIAMDALMTQGAAKNVDCETGNPIGLAPTTGKFSKFRIRTYPVFKINIDPAVICSDYQSTLSVYQGSNSLTEWQAQAQAMFAKYHLSMVPEKEHFIQVSTLLMRGCAGLMGGDTDDADKCSKMKFNVVGKNKIPVDKPRGLIEGPAAWRRAWPAQPAESTATETVAGANKRTVAAQQP